MLRLALINIVVTSDEHNFKHWIPRLEKCTKIKFGGKKKVSTLMCICNKQIKAM